MGKNLKLFLYLFVAIFLFTQVYSVTPVEVFSGYNTSMTIFSNNTISVTKILTLKNVNSIGIVPGQIEFKIGQGDLGSISNINITNVIAKDNYGNKIPFQIRTTKNYTVIILNIFYPLLPGFEYKFSLKYTMKYYFSGIFFKSLQIPIRESTVPIENGSFSVLLPSNYHFTYLSSKNFEKVNLNQALWNIKKNSPEIISFEYSYIPIKILNFRGSYVFWILIDLLLALFILFEITREVRRVKRG